MIKSSGTLICLTITKTPPHQIFDVLRVTYPPHPYSILNINTLYTHNTQITHTTHVSILSRKSTIPMYEGGVSFFGYGHSDELNSAAKIEVIAQ